MSLDPSRKETLHLWSAIVLLTLVACYRLIASVTGAAPAVPEWLPNVVSLAVVVLLWTAYRRWTETIRRRRELEMVIKGIGPDMLMVVRPDRTIAMCNESVEAIFGYTVREILGRTTDLLYFDRRVTGEKREIHDRLEKIGFHTGFAQGRRKDGRVIPLEIVTGDLPHQPGAVMLIRDITERRQAEEQLIRAKEQAEKTSAELRELEHLRDNLTHMIVHDLKSPLTALSGYIELLTRYGASNLTDKQKEFLGEASRLTRRLADMINTLLDLRRLESNELPMNRSLCDLRELTADALRELGPEAAQRQVAVLCETEAPSGFCDPDLTRRVITNLIHNALKFTPRNGAVTIALSRQNESTRVAVADTGPGIPREFHARIFDRFAQLDAREFSTGLGLTFCKLAVEAQGGAIGLESEVGRGSTFWFTVAATPRTSGAPEAEAPCPREARAAP